MAHHDDKQALTRDHEQMLILVEEHEGRKYASLRGLWAPDNGPLSDWYDCYDFPHDAHCLLRPVELLPGREYAYFDFDGFGEEGWFADTSCLAYYPEEADMGYEAFLHGRCFEFAGWGSMSANSPCGLYLLGL